VDEATWLNGTDLGAMLALLRERGQLPERKALLFGAACCRGVWSAVAAEGLAAALEVGERYADGRARWEELETAVWQAEQAAEVLSDHIPAGYLTDPPPALTHAFARRACAVDAVRAALGVACVQAARAARESLAADADESLGAAEQANQCALLRDLVGNPFRAAPAIDPATLRWRDGLVVRLATATYDERVLPAGTFRPDRLAVLADALEEAGCTAAGILAHLRERGAVHTRGCHVVDLLLGKS
jgi:hypothetical protein